MSREEDAYVIDRMGKLLAEIAIIVNGAEPHDTLWSYRDLPAKVRALKVAQHPAPPPAGLAAVPAGYVPVSALIEARDHVEDWAAYSSPYFQEKHDLAGVLAEIDAQIAVAQAQQPAALAVDTKTQRRLVESLRGAIRNLDAADSYEAEGLCRDAVVSAARALAKQPAAAVPEGWRVMWFTGTVTRDSERWEVYDPDGNGGAVDKGDVRDDMVRGLLDALAAANKENNNGNS